MTWNATNLIIEIVAGTFGAYLAALLAYGYRFGVIGPTIVGPIGGIMSGYLVEAAGLIVRNGSGPDFAVRPLDQMVEHGLMSAIAGGILTLIVGFLKYELDRRRTARRKGRKP
jgi:hypothetical protein